MTDSETTVVWPLFFQVSVPLPLANPEDAPEALLSAPFFTLGEQLVTVKLDAMVPVSFLHVTVEAALAAEVIPELPLGLPAWWRRSM